VLVKTIQNKRCIHGGGNSEVRMAIAVENLAKQVKGKESLAIKGFAEALRAMPLIIADNGGYDSSELVQNLVYEIETNNNHTFGLDMYNGEIDCMNTLGIRVRIFWRIIYLTVTRNA
jgi:T-complex protein 1 subunit beta